MKKQTKLKVIIFIATIIIIIGGGFMIINNNSKNNITKEKNELKENNKNNEPKENNNDKENDKSKDNNEEKESDKKINADEILENLPTTNSKYKTAEDGYYKTEKGYPILIIKGVTYINDLLIVNKTYSLPEDYKPEDPYANMTSDNCKECLNKNVMDAFNLMKTEAGILGLNLYISSGYRSYNYQKKLYDNYTAVSGTVGADTYSARPGHSEHQTGLAFDLNSVDDSFANTDEGKWINDNAHLYGFIIRYPKGKEKITGYQYEPWHLRYVGYEIAKALYNNGSWLSIEEYFGITSSY